MRSSSGKATGRADSLDEALESALQQLGIQRARFAALGPEQQRLALQAAMKQQATAPAAPAGAVTVPPPNMAQVIARQQALARAMPQVQAQAAPVVAASPRPVTTPLKAAIARADAPPQVDPGTIQRINQAVPQSAKPLPTGEELKQMARDLSRLDKALDKAEDALDRGSIGVKDFRAISDERNALYKKIQGLTQ